MWNTIEMSLAKVSPNYPELHVVSDEQFGMKFSDYSEWNLSEKSIGPEFIAADCWGLAIQRADGSVEPQFNTYALFDAIGRSFGVGRKHNIQHEWEALYRDTIIEDFDLVLDKLNVGDAVIVYMFGTPDTWGLRMTKMDVIVYQFML